MSSVRVIVGGIIAWSGRGVSVFTVAKILWATFKFFVGSVTQKRVVMLTEKFFWRTLALCYVSTQWWLGFPRLWCLILLSVAFVLYLILFWRNE